MLKIVRLSFILGLVASAFLSSPSSGQQLYHQNNRHVSPHMPGESTVSDPDTAFTRYRDYFQRHKQARSQGAVRSPSSTTYDSALTPVGEWAWGPCLALDIQGNFAYIGNGRSFQILDMTDLSAPKIVGEYVTTALILDVRLRGDSVAFVCNWDGFMIFDVSNPASPQKLSELSLWGGNRVIPTDSFAYVASGGILSVVDITDLRNPYIRSQAAGDEGAGDRDEIGLLNGRYLYLGDGGWHYGIYVYDCSNPDHIQELPNLNIFWSSLLVCDRHSMLLVGTSQLRLYSLNNPSNPVFLDSLKAGSGVDLVTESDYGGDYPYDVAFTGSRKGWIYTIDISSYLQPHILDSLYVSQIALGQTWVSIPKSRGTFGVANYIGLVLADAQDPTALQTGSFFVAGGDGPSDVALQSTKAYLANGSAGLAILDITNPQRPIRVGSLPVDGAEIFSVAVEGSYAYIAGTYGYGFWTVDVSNPKAPVKTGWVSMGSPRFPPLELTVDKNRAYVGLYDSAIVVVDVTNPAAPSRLGIYTQSVLSLGARDSLLYLPGMSILNVSDPQHIMQVSQLQLPSYAILVDSTFAYNGGFSDTGLTVVDISISSRPAVVSAIGLAFGGGNATDMAKSGKYVYVSGNVRLNAVDVSNPVSPMFVASHVQTYSWGVAAQDRYVYLSESIDGLQIFENKLIPHHQPYSFNAGWNMISVPSFPGGNSGGTKGFLFPSSVSSAFTYRSGYTVQDTIKRGIGYWLKFDSPQDVLLPDQPVYSETIAVTPGWNMIGSVSIPVPVSHIGSNPPDIETSQFFGLSGSAGYEIADTIQPCKGYWVRVNQPATLILPAEVPSGKTVPASTIRILPTSERPPSMPASETSQRLAHPKEFSLKQNHPNPFNPSTEIRYVIPATSWVTLKVYDLLGRVIGTLVNELKHEGEYSITWTAAEYPSGVYYYVLSTSAGKLTRKMVVIK